MSYIANNHPGALLRQAWQQGTVQIPGVYNPLVARLAEQAGFQAIYLSGAALSASMGLPDVGLVTLSEFVDFARGITTACSLPLISDADTGFGEALNVERTVQQFEAAGVAGIHLEDQVMPKRCGHLSGKKLVSLEEMAAKVRAAAGSRRNRDFVIIARTDARGVTDMKDAIQRAIAYREAGADVIFVEALKSEAEFAEFAKEVPGPLLANMTEFGQTPLMELSTLSRLGYQLVIYPVTLLRLALQSTRVALQAIKQEGTQKNLISQMLTRQELYDLLGYTGYEARDRAYFGK
ncbi:MAG: methylisocitrate lyase [Planctomycetia bacterium]|nr:methylisocitrate lyase [Planctomycetia bacterium]